MTIVYSNRTGLILRIISLTFVLFFVFVFLYLVGKKYQDTFWGAIATLIYLIELGSLPSIFACVIRNLQYFNKSIVFDFSNKKSLLNNEKMIKVNSLSFEAKNTNIILPTVFKFLRITEYLYSPKTQKEVFKPIAYDGYAEYAEALFKKEKWKARWINVRYIYAFLLAMWQKSPIGDLIEFVIKIAKQ